MDQKKKKSKIKIIIDFLDGLVNFFVLLLLIIFLSYGLYNIWDSKQVVKIAQSESFSTYKPKTDTTLPFDKLKEKNPEVFAWLNVYGTKIDYPVAQAKDNEKYVNTDILGDYRISGSIFLDYRDSKDFTDFNSILFGHHMEGSAMFGDLEKFKDKNFFENHQFANIFLKNRNIGVEFFAFLTADAFDNGIYLTPLNDTDAKEKYLSNIRDKAIHRRNLDLNTNDKLLILSTCVGDSISDRYILVGKLLDKEVKNPFEEKNKKISENDANSSKYSLGEKIKKFLPIILIPFALLFLLILRKKMREK